MYKQKIAYRYISGLIIILVIAAAVIVLPRVMQTEENGVLEVFTAGSDRKYEIEGFADNFLVHIINAVIPAAKTSYEKHTGEKMPGIAAATIGNLVERANVDLSDPRTYFRFVFVAFSQYEPTESSKPQEEDNKLPEIVSFEDAPEGAIYFSEEDEYNAEQAMLNSTGGQQDSRDISVVQETQFEDPEKIAFNKKSPEVLIYHSHTSECYMPVTTGNFHTMDARYNVLSIGEIMTDVIQKKYKYKVLHNKTYHDTESYAYSYSNSLLTVKESMNRDRSIKVVLDIHRDGFSSSLDKKTIAEKKKGYTVKINKKDAAKIMLVVGKDNPNYKELEKFAVYIQKKMDKLYPGLFLRIDRKAAKYNQYVSDYAMLIEVGCSYNTIEEAKYSAELLGNVIGEVLKDLEQ
ncbi:MAG: stage II sporulation protein P [Bacillota bacterium]